MNVASIVVSISVYKKETEQLLQDYKLIGDWQVISNYRQVNAEKEGKKYCIRVYNTPVYPKNNGILDRNTYEHNKLVFGSFFNERLKYNSLLRYIQNNHYLEVPCDEFLHNNSELVEVYEFLEVEQVIIGDNVWSVILNSSYSERIIWIKQLVSELVRTHQKNALIGNISDKCFGFVKTDNGTLIAHIIDFSCISYDNDTPCLAVNPFYLSPEYYKYIYSDLDKDYLLQSISNKTDIFSMGLLMHLFLSGALPGIVNGSENIQKRIDNNKEVPCCVALLEGGNLKISENISECKYITLIENMLKMLPEDRPDACEVLEILKM